MYHYKVMAKVREILFSSKDYFTPNDLIEKVSIKNKGYWLVIKDKRKVLLTYKQAAALPVVAKSFKEMRYNKKVYDLIEEAIPRKIRPEKRMSFRDLVLNVCPFGHSDRIDYLLYKILVLASITTRINARISALREFGKSSIYEVLNHLFNNIGMLPPNSTLAKAEYYLYNKVLFWEEVSNQKAEQIQQIQHFLLIAGDGRNEYTKSSRASKSYGTQDTYDISNLSIVLVYNTYKEYQNKDVDGKDHSDLFFDKVMDMQTRSRFIPFTFDGKLDFKDFNVRIPNPKKQAEDNLELYQSVRRTISYYTVKENIELEVNSKPWEVKKYSGLSGRWNSNFEEICETIKLFAKDKEEFEALCDCLFLCHLNYNKMLKENNNLFNFAEFIPTVDKKALEIKIFGSPNKFIPVTQSETKTNVGVKSDGLQQTKETKEVVKETVKMKPGEYLINLIKLGVEDIGKLDTQFRVSYPKLFIDEEIGRLKLQGDIFEYRPGFVKVL